MAGASSRMVVTVAPPLVARRSMLRVGLAGFALGAAWGVAARVFMRLVSTEPGFSWSGTLGIVGLSAVLGTGVALAGEARLQRRRVLWWLTLPPGLLLLAGPGMVFIPALVLGGVFLHRRNPVARLVAITSIAGPGVVLWWTERLDEVHMLAAPVRVQLGYLLGLPLLSLLMAAAGSLLWGPRRAAVLASASPPTSGANSHTKARGIPATSASLPTSGADSQTQDQAQSDSPERARSSLRNDSSLEAPAGPA